MQGKSLKPDPVLSESNYTAQVVYSNWQLGSDLLSSTPEYSKEDRDLTDLINPQMKKHGSLIECTGIFFAWKLGERRSPTQTADIMATWVGERSRGMAFKEA